MFIFTGYSDIMMQDLFKDILELNNVKTIKKLMPFSPYINGLLRGLSMRLFHYPICQYAFNAIDILYHPLENVEIEDENSYLIFTNAACIGISVPYVKKYLKQHTNCTPVMLFMDPLDRYWAQYAKFLTESIPQFLCFTFDPQDAQRNGFQYTMNVYSYHEPEPGGTKSDIYFSFFGLDRLDMVKKIAAYLGEKNVNCNFVYVDSSGKGEPDLGSIHYMDRRLRYSEILKDAAQANCLLEILRPGQTGSTLRYYEAVCYNKKLLTTNKNVVNLPFYDSRYIKIFENPSDIDYDWVCRYDTVDYHYDGSFSPIHFLEEIETSSNRAVKYR